MRNKIICPNCGEENNYNNKNCNSCYQKLLLNDKYILTEVLGENNQITYLGYFNLETKVVIKELNVTLLYNWKIEELFEREISTLKELNHNQIPKLIDNFQLTLKNNKNHYLVMEFIDGVTLKEKISKKLYTEKEALEVLKELTVLLNYLHSLKTPIIHRDIKPSNIIIRKNDNKFVLIDFGAVADLLKSEGGSTVVGTYGFMAPEQFMGKVSVQSDYYSLGGVLINLLTQKEPNNMIGKTDEFISSLNISDQMKFLISKLMKLKLKDRVKNSEEILTLIDNFENLKYEHKVVQKIKKEIKANIDNELEDFKTTYYEIYRILRNNSIDKSNFFISIAKKLYQHKIKLRVVFALLVFLYIYLLNIYPELINSPVFIFLWIYFVVLNKKEETSSLIFFPEEMKNEQLYVILEDEGIFGELEELKKDYNLNENKIIIYRKLLKEIKEDK